MRSSDLWPLWVFLGGFAILMVLAIFAGDPDRDRCRKKGGHYVRLTDGYACIKALEVWK